MVSLQPFQKHFIRGAMAVRKCRWALRRADVIEGHKKAFEEREQ